MSKGSNRRRAHVSEEAVARNWEVTYGQKIIDKEAIHASIPPDVWCHWAQMVADDMQYHARRGCDRWGNPLTNPPKKAQSSDNASETQEETRTKEETRTEEEEEEASR